MSSASEMSGGSITSGSACRLTTSELVGVLMHLRAGGGGESAGNLQDLARPPQEPANGLALLFER